MAEVEAVKFRYSRKEAAISLGMCLRTLDMRIASGAIQTVRDGKKVFITREVLRRYAGTNNPNPK